MKLINKISRKFNMVSFKVIDEVRSFIRYQDYLGYDLYYSRGTSLINMIDKETSLYEPKTCEIITEGLKKKENPIFIDIGANIGLISLSIYTSVPNVKIFAFEPGPHQNMLFTKTITGNNLSNAIELFSFGLSDKNGEATFHVHNTCDVSGDGFFDTGRAGKSTEIKVPIITLDKWWNINNKPYIDVIKIDTEGSELLVLKGAFKLIATCKPLIVVEICNLNCSAYPYNAVDIVQQFHEIGYNVYTEKGEIATLSNIDHFQQEAIYTYYCKAK